MKTKKFNSLILFCLVSAFTIGQNKIVSTQKSTLQWTGKAAFNAYSLTGELNVKSGNLIIKNDSIKFLNIVIDMKSLDHGNKDLKKHLRSKDFFEVNKYTEASFKVTRSTEIKNGQATITGELTIKNITKIENFNILFNEDHTNLSFVIKIDRTSYGVKFNSPSFFKKLKENAIADEFKLRGHLILD